MVNPFLARGILGDVTVGCSSRASLPTAFLLLIIDDDVSVNCLASSQFIYTRKSMSPGKSKCGVDLLSSDLQLFIVELHLI